MKTLHYSSTVEITVMATCLAMPLQAQSLAGGCPDAVGFGAMGGVMLLLLGWIQLLRRRVRRFAPSEAARNEAKSWENEGEFLRALLEHSSDQIYFKDRESRFLRCSNAVCKRWGLTPQGMAGKTDFDCFDDSHARPAFEDEQEIIRTGVAFDGKVEREILKDGTEKWALTSKMPLRNKAGEIIGTFGISKDITDLKRTETQLSDERDLLSSLLDHAPDRIYFKDRQSHFVRVSWSTVEWAVELVRGSYQKSANDLGAGGLPPHLASPTEFAPYMLGKTDFDIYPGEERARAALEDEQEIMRTGAPIVGKLQQTVYPSGEIRWGLTTKMPWRGPDGTIIGTFGISKDITDLKRTESQLTYERDLLTTLLDNTPDTIYFKDCQSRFVRVSRSKVEQSLALARSRHQESAKNNGDGTQPPHLANSTEFARYLLGKTDFNIFSEDRARPAFEDEQEIIRTGVPMVGKLEETVWPDGKTSWCVTTKMPWRGADGTIIGTFGVSKDVSFIKEAEAKLESINKQLIDASRLAGMAEVATTVLHNVGNVLNSVNVSASVVADKVKNTKTANLVRVVEMLREHQEDLGAFLTKDARGSKLPAYLATLAECLATEQQEMLGELASLRSNIEHINEIVAMQQAYAKVAGLQETLKPTDLIEDAMRMNAGAVERHHVQVIRDYSPTPAITVDKHKVLQILVNLICNAKYALDDCADVEKQMTLRAGSGENGMVRICVIDNGGGVAPENLKRIFEHGFTTRQNGHGFALHSGALAARQMGGSLSCQSAGPGRGATFILELPLNPPEKNS